MIPIKSNEKNAIVLVSLLLLFITGTLLISLVPRSVRFTNKKLETLDGETISVNIAEPIRGLKIPQNTPAVIIGHGYMANKEFMKGYALEIAAAGFVVVTLDFRGHGQSTGSLDRNRLLFDVLAVKTYLASRLDVDIHNLAYIGYSMGGFPGNLIVNSDPDFKAFIGVGTSLQYGLRQGNSSHPLNVLMIHAKYDEAFNLEVLRNVVGLRAGKLSPLIDVNQLYGNFQEGNATMIYLDDNSNHLSVAWDTDFIRASRNWLINTFPTVLTADEDFYGHLRLLILILQVIGGFGVFFSLMYMLSRAFGFHPSTQIEDIEGKKNDNNTKEEEIKDYAETSIHMEFESRLQIDIGDTTSLRLFFLTLLYTLIFGIIGIFLIVWAFLFIPQPIIGFVFGLLFGASFGILLLIYRLGKKREISLKAILKKPFTDSKKDLAKYVVLGIILAGFLYLILYLSFGRNYIGIVPSIIKAPWIPLYSVIAFLIFFVYGLYIFLIVKPKLVNRRLATLKIIIIHFGILFIYVNAILLAMGLLTGSFFFWGVMIPVSTPLLIISACVDTISFKRTGNIIMGALINAIYFTVIVTTIAPFQGLFTLFSVF
ncbi:MAG: conserved membrane protein of unknown function [Promethearchaeota archaeon]|nr:MAG: conserved membrane protein of unknown function [Candidatus Lokiarchaeota archaeon]